MEKSKILAIIALVVFGAIIYISQKPPSTTTPATQVTDSTVNNTAPPEPEDENNEENKTEEKKAADSDIPQSVDHLVKNDVKVGTGEEAKSGDTVTVHYRGTLTNGSQFDSSYDRNEPFTFHLGQGQVIEGWDEGVQGMKVGGKRQLIIPSDMGYGVQGAGSDIPPNATLVFDVELLKVEK